MLALVLATAVSASPANVYPARLRRSLFADEVRLLYEFLLLRSIILESRRQKEKRAPFFLPTHSFPLSLPRLAPLFFNHKQAGEAAGEAVGEAVFDAGEASEAGEA